MTPRERFECDVTLHDGRVVGSWSREWLQECEAREVLNLPTKRRRIQALAAIEQRRGKEARDRLANLIMSIWTTERSNRTNRP